MRGDDAVGLENELGLLASDGGIVQKGTSGLEFVCEELDSFAFCPLRIVFAIGNACGVEELGDGLIVKFRVLADIEGSKVESEDLQLVA